MEYWGSSGTGGPSGVIAQTDLSDWATPAILATVARLRPRLRGDRELHQLRILLAQAILGPAGAVLCSQSASDQRAARSCTARSALVTREPPTVCKHPPAGILALRPPVDHVVKARDVLCLRGHCGCISMDAFV